MLVKEKDQIEKKIASIKERQLTARNELTRTKLLVLISWFAELVSVAWVSFSQIAQ